MDTKTVFGIIAVLLTFGGYIPYFRSIISGKTKPHLYSWLVWALDAFIIFILQVNDGAGAGAYMTLAVAIMCLGVLGLTVYKKAKSDITISDTIFLIVALIALIVWLLAKQPLLSAILIMSVDVFGFLPTLRKSWHKPHSETPIFYAINIIRFGCTLVALKEYTIITMLYPAFWFVGNMLFTTMLLVRRKII